MSLSNKHPIVFMLIGLPASGKSTYVETQLATGSFDPSHYYVASTDSYIEKKAAEQKKTYNECFPEYIKEATAHVNQNIQIAIRDKKDVIWDQTNLSENSRKSKLALFPKDYVKIAVYFLEPEKEEYERRLKIREMIGKTIPPEVVATMKKNMVPPSLKEGFERILVVRM